MNFLDQIAKFWELQGYSLKIPLVERRPLDLYSLHRAVQDEGGLAKAFKDRKWTKIAVRLGFTHGKNVGTILKGHYEKILYPFDVFVNQDKGHVERASAEQRNQSQEKKDEQDDKETINLVDDDEETDGEQGEKVSRIRLRISTDGEEEKKEVDKAVVKSKEEEDNVSVCCSDL